MLFHCLVSEKALSSRYCIDPPALPYLAINMSCERTLVEGLLSGPGDICNYTCSGGKYINCQKYYCKTLRKGQHKYNRNS